MPVISDDIGSFPLPIGVARNEIEEIAFNIACKKASEQDSEKFTRIISEIMQKKIDSGILCPNYPQVQEMIEQFFKLSENFHNAMEPFVVKSEFAKILEIDAIDSVAKENFNLTGKPIELRVCVTGPLELYLRKIGSQVQGDLLRNLGISISRFVENSIIKKEYLKTRVICIDEPSLGLNPNIIIIEEDLIKSLEISVKPAKNLDVQIHLHSPREIETIYQTEGIKIIGIESAENPNSLEEIDKRELEGYDKFLRVGISRTNISGIAANFNEKSGIDVWKTKNFDEMIDGTENSRNIGKRLENAWKLFNDNIKYAGPDCGLGAWPNQEIAFKLLKNTAEAVDRFNKESR